ncbi:MAG TPA: hypothetical protein VNJ01_16120 [Bacteriovoracaceae bacterium]|nr:hypothetical protein [Bacteriovoracaceae bacterium]
MKIILFMFVLSTELWSQSTPELVIKARRLHVSLTGTLPTKVQMQQTISLLSQQRAREAAVKIIQEDENFYNVTVKSMVTPWSNKTSDHSKPLNDMTALLLGFIRDDIPFNQVFYRDSLYVFRGTLIGASLSPALQALLTEPEILFVSATGFRNGPSDVLSKNETAGARHQFLKDNFPGSDRILIKDPKYPKLRFIISKYAPDRNSHFEEAESLSLDLSNSNLLKIGLQSDYLYSDPKAVSGILSTREFAKAYLQAGTNRAGIAYIVPHMFCRTMDQLKDGTLSDEYVRKDIPRIPGGLETTYKNNCVACHTGLDPLSNAFAYHDYYNATGKVLYTPTTVVAKLNATISNDDTQIGTSVSDDYWINFWKSSLNSRMGWGTTNEGYGLFSLGKMLSETKQFSNCMSQRVYEKVCLNNIRKLNSKERDAVVALAASFELNNYNMKNLFAETSVSCKE